MREGLNERVGDLVSTTPTLEESFGFIFIIEGVAVTDGIGLVDVNFDVIGEPSQYDFHCGDTI